MLRSCPSQSKEICRFIPGGLSHQQAGAKQRPHCDGAISRGRLLWRKCTFRHMVLPRIGPMMTDLFFFLQTAVVHCDSRCSRAIVRCASYMGWPWRNHGDADVQSLFRSIFLGHFPRHVPLRLKYVRAALGCDPRACGRIRQNCRTIHSTRRQACGAIRQEQWQADQRRRFDLELCGRAVRIPLQEGWLWG